MRCDDPLNWAIAIACVAFIVALALALSGCDQPKTTVKRQRCVEERVVYMPQPYSPGFGMAMGGVPVGSGITLVPTRICDRWETVQ